LRSQADSNQASNCLLPFLSVNLDDRWRSAEVQQPLVFWYHRSVVSATFALSVDGSGAAVGRRRGGRRHRRARRAEVADEGGIAVARAGGVREPG